MTTIIVRRGALPNTLREIGRELRAGRAAGRSASIPLDVIEDADGYSVLAVLPGVAPESIEVRLAGQALSIAGELRLPELAEGSRYRLRELAGGRFERSLRLAYPVDADAVQANYSHGLLSLRLPKAESSKPRRIAVSGPEAVIDA